LDIDFSEDKVKADYKGKSAFTGRVLKI